MTMYMVAGTQADKAAKNQVNILKMSELHRNRVSKGREANPDIL